jgi:hypothetical protein
MNKTFQEIQKQISDKEFWNNLKLEIISETLSEDKKTTEFVLEVSTTLVEIIDYFCVLKKQTRSEFIVKAMKEFLEANLTTIES